MSASHPSTPTWGGGAGGSDSGHASPHIRDGSPLCSLMASSMTPGMAMILIASFRMVPRDVKHPVASLTGRRSGYPSPAWIMWWNAVPMALSTWTSMIREAGSVPHRHASYAAICGVSRQCRSSVSCRAIAASGSRLCQGLYRYRPFPLATFAPCRCLCLLSSPVRLSIVSVEPTVGPALALPCAPA